MASLTYSPEGLAAYASQHAEAGPQRRAAVDRAVEIEGCLVTYSRALAIARGMIARCEDELDEARRRERDVLRLISDALAIRTARQPKQQPPPMPPLEQTPQ